MEEKNRQIAELEKEMLKLKSSTVDNSNLQESLSRATEELASTKQNLKICQRKLNFTKKATEQLLVDDITNTGG